MYYHDSGNYSVAIETQRLVLLPMEEQDAAPIYSLFAKKEVDYPYIDSNLNTANKSLRECVDDYVQWAIDVCKSNEGLVHTIRKPNEHEVIGVTVLIPVEEDSKLLQGGPGIYEVGYFVSKWYRNKRIATEAIVSCVQYGFEKLGLTGLRASVGPGREQSDTIVRNLGMELVTKTPAGSPLVPYTNKSGERESRNIYATPANWNLQSMKYKF